MKTEFALHRFPVKSEPGRVILHELRRRGERDKDRSSQNRTIRRPNPTAYRKNGRLIGGESRLHLAVRRG